MATTQRVIAKYLQQYAEPEAALLASMMPHTSYEQVIVIPAYKESDDFVHRFFSSKLSADKVLMIVVINQPESVNDDAPQRRLQQQCMQLGKAIFKGKNQAKNITLIDVTDHNSDILLVDRFTAPIADKHGVGLARKIGCDIAVALIAQGMVSSPFIHSTDADATLPDNYFIPAKRADKSVVALGFDFSHHSESSLINQANAMYEAAMRFYVDGLKRAGSPYAFFTIGSTLAFTAVAYCQCRGFPKRSAGEDFYLLNKLAKLGNYHFASDVVIQLQARISDRVPFGTGPAVERIVELLKQQQAYHYYNPKVFDELTQVLSAFERLYEQRQQLADWYQQLSSPSSQALIDIGLTKFIRQHQNVHEKQFYKQLHGFFDAFKTLKFIHALRDFAYPDVPLVTGHNSHPL